MRKIYSLVLMATMLLIGTNAWAVYPAGWLQDQFDAIEADGQTHTITMEDDITLTAPVYLGTKTVDEERKSIILDMNGHHITMSATTWVGSHPDVFCHMFIITHGELLVRNNASDKATNPSLIQMTGTGDGKYNDIFTVTGSYKSSRWQKSGDAYVINESDAINTRDEGWFTHLEIGEGVKLYAPNTVSGAGITMDGYHANNKALVSSAEDATGTFGSTRLNLSPSFKADYICLYGRSDAPAYNTAILNSATRGVAYGLRVDVFGDIEFATGSNSGKSYGIKLNGDLRSSLRENEIFQNQYCWPMDEAYAKTYGATAAPVNNPAQNLTCTIVDPYYTNHKLDTIDAPFLYVHSSAHITAAAELNEATAVYCSGYGKALIEGACSGNSGVNVKSGRVELHDAEITCTASDYSQADEGNHATGSGGVIVNSVENRAGGIEVIISGDTKVSTTVGYAIEETVNKTGGSDVSSIAIQGGTIEGGTLGAIALTTDAQHTTQVTGGNFNGTASVGGTTVDVSDLVPNTNEYHTTEVVVNDKTVIVVTQGAAPTAGNWVSKIDDTHPQIEGASVKWITNTVDAISGYLKLTELEINDFTDNEKTNPREQTLTIQSGATLEVGRVILGPKAHIIVKAGGKLLVTGTDGIIANQYDNITLESSESAQALFLFHPKVSSNRHPKATVQLTSKGYHATGKFIYQRFGVPAFTDDMKRGAVQRGGDAELVNRVLFDSPSAFYYVDYTQANDPWKVMADEDVFVPFQCYEVTCGATAPGTVYTFKCPLMGNADFTLPINGTWNYYANSYMAPIDINEMLTDFRDNNANLEATVYVYRSADNWWDALNLGDFGGYFAAPAQTTIDPMQAFIFRVRDGEKDAVINYKKHIYNPDPTTTPVAAPARNREVSAGTAMIEIAAADGAKDKLYLIESDNFSAEYDNGYDAAKYMNESFNLFASVNDEKMAKVATDNLEGTVLGMNTKEQTSFTMTISHVNNINYAIRDNVTGTEIEMVEGATYMFSTAANANIEGRFEIVPVAKMPTAIENIEETAAVKGIYTVTGQFVGNDYHSLPNGVYVIDGKKIVK